MTSSDDHPYEIGRGRPPIHSRFKPGQSGNPSGRPKRRRSFEMDLLAALDAATSANSDTTKQQKLAENLVNDALAGKALAMRVLVPIALTLDGGEADSEGHVTPEEQRLIQEFNRRQEPVSTTTSSQIGGDDG